MGDVLDKAYEQATEKLHATGEEIEKLSKPVSNFLLVYSAQGVIDKGALRVTKRSDKFM
jgi:hypothetical protein